MAPLPTYLLCLLPTLLPHAHLHRAGAVGRTAIATPLHMSASGAPQESAAAADAVVRRSWRARVKSWSAIAATAAVLAVPRGPARAAPLDAPSPAPVTRAYDRMGDESSHAVREPPAAFLGFGRRKKTLKRPLPRKEREMNEIHMDDIVSRQVGKRYTERSYIFSDGLVRRSDLTEVKLLATYSLTLTA